MKLIKQLSFLLIIFFFFTRASLAGTVVNANNTTVNVTSPITSTADDADPGFLLGVGIYNDGFTGLIINNSSNISITSTGTVNPYGIGILSSTSASSVTSITNSGTITSTTTGAAPNDGNSYGIFNNGQTGATIGTITNSGTIEGVSTGFGTARGINNTSGTINSIVNSGNIKATAGVGAREVLSGKTQKYSMNNTGVSFTTPNSGDYYASLAAGTNINVVANVNFTALVSAKMSEKETETYQASIGLKGTF